MTSELDCGADDDSAKNGGTKKRILKTTRMSCFRDDSSRQRRNEFEIKKILNQMVEGGEGEERIILSSSHSSTSKSNCLEVVGNKNNLVTAL